MNDREIIKLRVSDRASVAHGVLQLTLERPDGGQLPEWEPGAHLELRLPSGVLRQYSLCGDLDDRCRYTICVLREEAGRGGSEEIHRDVVIGTEIETRAPRNHFPLVSADAYLLLAGGIGVTPLKSMAEHLARAGATWKLVYGGRSLDSMAFRDELEVLGADRVTIVPQDTNGLIDLDSALDSLTPGTHIYSCGPGAMLAAVDSACDSRSLKDRLHIERFTASGSVEPQTPDAGLEDTAFEVELAQSGGTVQVLPGQTILDAVKAIRSDIDYSCLEGYCGTCETKVCAGEPDHRGTFLSPEEHDEDGTMLICISRARSSKLVLDV